MDVATPSALDPLDLPFAPQASRVQPNRATHGLFYTYTPPLPPALPLVRGPMSSGVVVVVEDQDHDWHFLGGFSGFSDCSCFHVLSTLSFTSLACLTAFSLLYIAHNRFSSTHLAI